MASLGDLIVRVGADISGFKTAMKDAVDQVDYFADEIEKRFDAIESVGKRLATVGAELTAAVTLPMVALGKAAIETAAQFEQTQIAFTTLTGSATAAKEELAKLYQFASETPFQVQGILQGTRTLLAMQYASKDVIPVLRTIGDAASGLGLGQEGLERMVFHFGQIKALGAIDGRVIRELGQAGINAGQMLADSLGKTVPEVLGMVHKKAIGSTVAINALLKGMNDKFGGLMKNQMESLSGMWTNLKDNVTLALVDIGNTLLPVGKVVVKFLIDSTEKVKELAHRFAALPKPVQAAVAAFAAIAALAGPIMVFLGGLAIILPPIIALIGAMSLALGVSAGTIAIATGGVVLLIPALVALGTWISGHMPGISAAVKMAWEGVSELWNATIGAPIRAVVDLFVWLYSQTASIWGAVGSVMKSTFEFIGALARIWWKSLKEEALDPFVHFISKIPGIAKLMSVGDVFSKADAGAAQLKKRTDEVAEAMKALRINSESAAAVLSDPKAAWAEHQKLAIDDATKSVKVLEEAYKRGEVKAADLEKAHKRLASVIAEKMPDFTEMSAKPTKDKISDQARADSKEIDQRVSHSKAMIALETDYAKFLHDSGRITEGEMLAQVEELESRELKIERAALEEKKKIYSKHLAERQGVENQIAALSDKSMLTLQKASERSALYYDNLAKSDAKVAQELAKSQAQLSHSLYKTREGMRAVVQAQTEVVDGFVRISHINASDGIRKVTKELSDQMKMVDSTTALVFLAINNGFVHINSPLENAIESTKKLDDAFRIIGGESTQMLIKRLGEVSEAYRLISTNSKATAEDIRKAWIAMEEARQKAVEGGANGKVTNKQRIQLSVEKLDAAGGAFKGLGGDMWKSTQSGFNSAIDGMIRGTQTFAQAWGNMGRNLLASWENTLLQAGLKWAGHQIAKLAIHALTNAGILTSDVALAGAQSSLSLAQHFKMILMAAKQAGAHAFASAMKLPIPINAIVAPIAAVAAFAGTMAIGAVSAEGGADLPDMNTVGLLHPREMVLPRNLADGMRNLISSGGGGGGSFSMGDMHIHPPDGSSPMDIGKQVRSELASFMRENHMQMA